MALQVLLATEPPVAELADEGLGGILGERLLPAASVGLVRKSVGGAVTLKAVGTIEAGLVNRVGVGLVGRLGAVALFLVGVRCLLRLVARGGGVRSGVHGRLALGLGLLQALVLVLVAVLARVRRAGEAADVDGSGVVKVTEIVLADEAGWAQGEGVRAGARAGSLASRLLAEVDEAVDKIVLGFEVGEIVKVGKTVGELGVEGEWSVLGDGRGWRLRKFLALNSNFWSSSSATQRVRGAEYSGASVELTVPTVRFRGSQKSRSSDEEDTDLA